MIADSTAENENSESLSERLAQIDQLGRWLDSAIQIPGTKFRIGWDTLIGLIPGIGDIATTLMSGWIIWQANQLGVSKWTLARMVGNVGLDAVLGSVPLVGDVFDAAFKSNQKNIALLKRHLKHYSRQQSKDLTFPSLVSRQAAKRSATASSP